MKHSKPLFVSYSREDADWVGNFVRSLEKLGVDVWFDQERLQPGEDLVAETENALRNNDGIICVLNRSSFNDPHVFFEIGTAIGSERKIIPVIAPDVDRSKVPLNLRKRFWVTRGDPHQTAEKVAAELTAQETSAVND